MIPAQTTNWFELPNEEAVEGFVRFMTGRDWTRAGDVLLLHGLEPSEAHKRRLRDLAKGSAGRICGHQRGYKLNTAMSDEEYRHYKNEWLKADASIRERINECDRVRIRNQPTAKQEELL